MIKIVIAIWALLIMPGCARTRIYTEAYDYRQEANDPLRRKNLELRIEKNIAINAIGIKILRSISGGPKQSYGYLGLLGTSLDEQVAQIFNHIEERERVVVYGLLKGGPAEEAGLRVGDIIVKINRKYVNCDNFGSLIATIKPDEACIIEVERNYDLLEYRVFPQRIPFFVNFILIDSLKVYSVAFPGGVAVSYGLLRLASNEDEMAMVLAHEIARLIQGTHLEKQQDDFNAALSLAVLGGSVALAQEGQLMQDIISFSQKEFSPELEREIDLLGIRLACQAGFDVEKGVKVWEQLAVQLPRSGSPDFMKTHPVSSERLVRFERFIRGIGRKGRSADNHMN